MPKTTEPTPSRTAAPVAHRGGCHCGAIRFEVELVTGFHGSRCNCSICAKTAATGAIVKPERVSSAPRPSGPRRLCLGRQNFDALLLQALRHPLLRGRVTSK